MQRSRTCLPQRTCSSPKPSAHDEIACVELSILSLSRTIGLLPLLLWSPARALRHRSPVALAESSADTLLAADAAEEILALALPHRFGHLLPPVRLDRGRRWDRSRRSGRGHSARELGRGGRRILGRGCCRG